ncbi:MAG: hypothetical protein KDK36_09920 [Leptospiraceae bacterium]|nr:hypothetical protein [Leptospiraceae bacterium]
MVLRFGLNSSLSRSLSDALTPTLEELNINLGNSNDQTSLKVIKKLAGFSQLSNQFKKNSEISVDDIKELISVFESVGGYAYGT